MLPIINHSPIDILQFGIAGSSETQAHGDDEIPGTI